MLIFRNHVPPPSRGRTGGGWGCPAQDSPHPHPSPPLEGEGEFLKRKISTNQELFWVAQAFIDFVIAVRHRVAVAAASPGTHSCHERGIPEVGAEILVIFKATPYPYSDGDRPLQAKYGGRFFSQ